MNDLEDRRDQLLELNKVLLLEYANVAPRLLKIAQPPHGAVASIFYSFYLKAWNSLKASILLYNNDLHSEAQSLIRIVFELRVNFDCYVEMTRTEKGVATQRVIDSMVIEKIKQLRVLKQPLDENVAGPFFAMEEPLRARYPNGEYEQIRKFGFTKMSIEKRAEFVDQELAYNAVYRNLSRNIHSSDFMEHLYDTLPGIPGQKEHVLNNDNMCLYLLFTSAAGIAIRSCDVFDLDGRVQLDDLHRKLEDLVGHEVGL